jgi:predicted secreted hydrolase
MNVRIIALLFLLIAVQAKAEGFAGLGESADGFAIPERGTALVFPRDHAPHPEYRIEWWYITANLKGADGKDYGVQWTLFRSALQPEEKPGWQSPQLWLGHAALTTPDQHFVAERMARGGIGQAGVTLDPFTAWIDDWQFRSLTAASADAISHMEMRAAGMDFSYALNLNAEGPIVLQGDRGYSVKSAEGQASYYFSQPFYRVEGKLNLPQGEVAVTGKAWLDREWSSQPLSKDQTGWDWFSLHFETGAKLMGFRLRDSKDGFTSATWINPDGTTEPQAPQQLKLTALESHTVAGREIPIRWRLELPAKNLDIETAALNPDAWMSTQIPYWEGPARVTGSHPGIGYVEMTGY